MSVAVTAIGSPGSSYGGLVLGGRAATVSGTLDVTPGQTLYVEVGGTTIEGSGFNVGGRYAIYSGGGATDVRSVPRASAGSLDSRLIVAAGGGGRGDIYGKDADAPDSGGPCSAGTATQTAGGAGAGGGDSGGLGSGGGGYGGGGGGLYGGGGSGYLECATGGGGGGGSSLVPAAGTKDLADRTTAPSVRFTFTPPTDPGPTDTTGASTDRTPPSIDRLAISPTIFTAANSGPALIAAVGGRVAYRLSEAASVAFTAERALKGRKKGKRCVAKGKGKRCTRYVKVKGSFAHAGVAGPNEFLFMGRLGSRQLRSGRYRLVAIAADAAGNRSKPVTRNFRIR